MGKTASMIQKMRQALIVIPKEHNEELRNRLTYTNITRVVAMSKVLMLLTLLTIVMDMTLYRGKWSINQGYVNLFIAHIILLAERSIFLIFADLMKERRFFQYFKLKKVMIIYSCIITLVWGAYVSANAQQMHGQISAYIIGCFCVGSVIFLLPLESFLVFSSCSLIFTYMLSTRIDDVAVFAADSINIIFVFIFVYVMSLINVSLFTKNYSNRKIIQAQAQELRNSRNKLEETVKIRTEELVQANEQLVKEMGMRHEIELQSIKTRLMYEENAMKLNEIKEYEELRNVFFANLSHELRTPVNVIFSAQQMMNFLISRQSQDSIAGQLDKYNKIVKQNCYRLIRLIGNLIDITKIDAKYFEIKKRNCDIVKIVENITQSVAIYIRDKNMDLCFETELQEKVIACDPDKIERIMLNLLSNAVKFTPDFGKITVKMSGVQDKVLISVKDTGIGINKEMQSAIFERFIQADKSMTRNREGSGIGLSLVKSLVDLHDGRIYLVSELGQGSEFFIELPDASIPFEDCVACTSENGDQNIERINIEFSDIYS